MAALRGAPAEHNGPGTQRRSFGQRDDAAAGMLKVLFSGHRRRMMFQYRQPERADLPSRSSPAKVVHAPASPGAIRQTPSAPKTARRARHHGRMPDISKAKATVGFDPAYTRRGIARINRRKRKKLNAPQV